MTPLDRSHVLDYVKKGNIPFLTIHTVAGLNFVYGIFHYIFLAFAMASHRFFFAAILTITAVSHWVLMGVLKRTVTELNFRQRFLLAGYWAMFSSVFFLLCAMVLVETASEFGLLGFALLLILWLFCLGLNLLIPWLRMQKGRYNTPGKMSKAVLVFAAALPIAAIMAKITAPYVSQPMSVVVGSGLFMIMSVFCLLGSPMLLKAHYIKRYDIPGSPIPCLNYEYQNPRSLVRNILVTFLKLLGLALAVSILVGIYFTSP